MTKHSERRQFQGLPVDLGRSLKKNGMRRGDYPDYLLLHLENDSRKGTNDVLPEESRVIHQLWKEEPFIRDPVPVPLSEGNNIIV